MEEIYKHEKLKKLTLKMLTIKQEKTFMIFVILKLTNHKKIIQEKNSNFLKPLNCTLQNSKFSSIAQQIYYTLSAFS